MEGGWIYFGTDSEDDIELHFLALSHAEVPTALLLSNVSTDQITSNELINRTDIGFLFNL